MGRVPERTLTAMLSPFSDGDAAAVPVLLAAGRGDRITPDDRRPIPVNSGLVIGRGAAAAADPGRLVLDDPLVSTDHARLSAGGDGYEILDYGSKNGTFVDGRRVHGTTRIGDGARVFVGHHVFVFRLVSAVEMEAIDEERGRPLGPVATASPPLAVMCHKLRRLAATQGELLLVGETGVGKEVYSRAVHDASGRKGRFVAINCAALPRELVESEIFGYRPGAHSTAHSGKSGLIEEADGGTLFLDEIGEMAPELQTKLLRFLQDKELIPLGSTRPRRIDVRVIASTNRPVAAGGGVGVRDDLLGRLGAAPILLAPLRDRIEDLGALAAHFLGARDRTPAFDLPAFRALFLHRWPLNVRELEKVLAAAVALAGKTRPVALRDLPKTVLAPAPAEPVSAAPAATSRKPPAPGPTPEELERLLQQFGGNVADVSRALGRQRAAVWRWIKQYGLSTGKHRG